MKPEDFEAIYNADGTCTHWDCGKQGVILAYDDFSPEIAHWFCENCWDDFTEMIYQIVIDRRQVAV